MKKVILSMVIISMIILIHQQSFSQIPAECYDTYKIGDPNRNNLMVFFASASNPVELFMMLPSPPPPDSVRIRITLGDNTCESMECEYFSVYITGSGVPQYLVSNEGWVASGSWSQITLPWAAVTEPNPSKICVEWVFSGTCTPSLPTPKICCVPYTGSGGYTIECSPCD